MVQARRIITPETAPQEAAAPAEMVFAAGVSSHRRARGYATAYSFLGAITYSVFDSCCGCETLPDPIRIQSTSVLNFHRREMQISEVRWRLYSGYSSPTLTSKFILACINVLCTPGQPATKMQFLSLSIGLLYFGIHAAAADNSTILSPTIDTFINNLLAEWKTPGGVGVAVVRMNAK